MDIYKKPILPSNVEKITNRLSKNNQPDESVQILLDSTKFENILIEDHSLVNQVLKNTHQLLEKGFPPANIPDFLLPRTLHLASLNPTDLLVAQSAVDFISYFVQLPEEHYLPMIDEIVQFLFFIIPTSHFEYIVFMATSCLASLIDVKRSRTIERIDTDNLILLATQILDNCPNKFPKDEQTRIIISAFRVIINCMISIDIHPENIKFLVEKVLFYFQLDSKSEDSLILKSASAKTLSYILFYRSEDYLINFFACDSFLNMMIHILCECKNEELIVNILCVLDNISFKNYFFALNIIIHPQSILNFVPSDEWSIHSKCCFCRPIITSIRRTSELREILSNDVKDEHQYQQQLLLKRAIEVLRRDSPNLIHLMYQYLGESFKLKKAAITIIGYLITLNDSQIIHTVMVGAIHITEEFVLLLSCKNAKIVYLLIKALRALCQFGDNISVNSNIDNPFLKIILDSDINEALQKCLEDYDDSKEITLSVNNFKTEITNYLNFQEIDQNSVENEITLYV